MKTTHTSTALFITLLAGVAHFVSAAEPSAPAFRPVIPKTWDDAAMAEIDIPLANSSASPKQVPAEFYYRIPVRPIHASYPVYHPDREPPGYFDQLRAKEPIVLWDDKGVRPALMTEADWIAAGKLVFDSPIGIGSGRIAASMSTNLSVRDPRWYRDVSAPLTPEGILPFYRYVIRERGKVEVGVLSCAMCHTRLMPDGSVISGAQGNFPFGAVFARDYRDGDGLVEINRRLERQLYAAPWIQPDPQAGLDEMSLEQIALPHSVIPPGVVSRHRSSPMSPVQVPDLIGLKDRRYLDRTGLQRHRDIVDLMRYAALNQGGDDLASYGGFVPATAIPGQMPSPEQAAFGRYSDEQLYALALFAYSLQPPPNPNLPKTAEQKTLVNRGKEIFMDSNHRCATCHKPPLYTNNKLTPARGFNALENHSEGTNLMSRSVGTDPTLATRTRRGTGFYKVPSLLGLWYRGPFEHNGSCATLEDWFNPARTNDTYVPTGWKGPPFTKTRAVKGHEFGLDLSPEDKAALIAFLKTL